MTYMCIGIAVAVGAWMHIANSGKQAKQSEIACLLFAIAVAWPLVLMVGLFVTFRKD